MIVLHEVTNFASTLQTQPTWEGKGNTVLKADRLRGVWPAERQTDPRVRPSQHHAGTGCGLVSQGRLRKQDFVKFSEAGLSQGAMMQRDSGRQPLY